MFSLGSPSRRIAGMFRAEQVGHKGTVGATVMLDLLA